MGSQGVETSIREETVFVVAWINADMTRAVEYVFTSERSAQWYSALLRKWSNTRCPKCGYKNIISVDAPVDLFSDEYQATVGCCHHACSFAKRFVSFCEPDET